MTAFGLMCHCCITRSKHIAAIHYWPLSQEWKLALYVIASSLKCHFCVPRSQLKAAIHCWSFSLEKKVNSM